MGLVTGPGVSICGSCAAIAVDVLTESKPRPDAFLLSDCRVASPHPRSPEMTITSDSSVVIKDGIVSWVGLSSELPSRYRAVEEIEAGGRLVTPGFVDAGAWVLGSTHHGRPDPEELVEQGRRSVSEMLSRGVTMLDLRVGGSADPLLETLLLAAARTVGDLSLGQVVVTWVVGPSISDEVVATQLAPAVSRLASFAMLTDTGGDLERRAKAVSPLPARLLLSAPEAVEADVLSVEFAYGVGSAPHSVVVLRPDSLLAGRSPALSLPGVRLALASGFDPHGVELTGMPMVMLMAAELAGLTPEGALWSATRGSALALGDETRGLVRKGAAADLLVHDAEAPVDILRRPSTAPWSVIVSGQILA